MGFGQCSFEVDKAQRSEDLFVSSPLLKVQAKKFTEQFGYFGFAYLNGWLD